jgi:N-acetylmuramoyl-L-alanine amidase
MRGAVTPEAKVDSGGGAHRIIIRFPNAVPAGAIRDLVVDDSLVRSVSTEKTADGATVTVALARAARYNTFTLKATQGVADRLVLDVMRPISPHVEARDDSLFAALRASRVRIVAVDAGHGGEDYGAIGPSGVAEKNVCLAIAIALVDRLNSRPGLHAFLTRKGDYFIPLRERTKIAKRAKADLFISVHANASRNRQAFGTEVYFLSPSGATDELARAVAQRENEADLVGGIVVNEDDDVANIVLDLAQSATVDRSAALAEAALDRLSTIEAITTRGVKQAGFAVLKTVDVPSILVETAFISNHREEQQLSDPTFQTSLADRLAGAVASYFTRFHEE